MKYLIPLLTCLPMVSNAETSSTVVFQATENTVNLSINGDAAEAVFNTLPKGCQGTSTKLRVNRGVSCVQRLSDNSTQCQFVITSGSVDALYSLSPNCSREK